MQEITEAHIRQSLDTKQKLLDTCLDAITHSGLIIASILENGNKLLLCGNGGSAADAQHIAAELVIRFRSEHERPALPALSLAADSSMLTAGGNDFGFRHVFSRQIEAFGKNGDGLIAFSTSGNSENIIEALKAARAKSMFTFFLTGNSGGTIFSEHRDLLDHVIRVPSDQTARIQESHILIGHIFCAITERSLYGIS